MWFVLGLVAGLLVGVFVVIPLIEDWVDSFGAEPGDWCESDELEDDCLREALSDAVRHGRVEEARELTERAVRVARK